MSKESQDKESAKPSRYFSECNKIEKIAILLKDLTYSEMMEISEYFSLWTRNDLYTDEEFEKFKDDEGILCLIDSNQMATNLNDWAENNYPEDYNGDNSRRY